MLNPLSTGTLFLVVLLFLTACRTNDRPASAAAATLDADMPGIQDKIFVQDALTAGRREIEMGMLGVEKANDLDLQLLAQRIFDDHTRASRELERIAGQERISSPIPVPADHPMNLANHSGSKFDQMYLQHMLEANREGIKKFEAAARSAQSSEIRDFAAKTLPVLREHYRIAQNIGKTAGLGMEINEAAGAEAPRQQTSPYYEGDLQRRHQFDRPR